MFTWICPVCTLPLHAGDKFWGCENKHNFDCAKSGYVNLLLPQHKASKHPGDSREMLLSRRAFLDAGHYQPVADAIATIINQAAPTHDAPYTLLDSGCGEGYYLHQIKKSLPPHWLTAGLDIAKEGINLAAKRYPNSTWICTSSARLPLAEKSLDVLLRVFAPGNEHEENKVLRDDGLLVIVGPAEKHLHSIKTQLYEQLKPYHPIKTPEGFKLIEKQEVDYTVQLNSREEVRQLLSMTPFFWHGDHKKREVLLQKNTLEIQVNMAILCFTKINV